MNKPVQRVSIAVMAMIVLLMANLTYVQVVQAGELRNDSRNQRVLLSEYSRLRGQIIAGNQVVARSVETDDALRYQREYPSGPAFASVTGYYSSVFASNGIERAEDGVLSGNDDRLFTRRLSDLITGRDPAGGNVVLTIDPEVQQTAFDELNERGFTGSVVALRPSTGEILAMVSTPAFDPNPLASHSSQAQQDAWDGFQAAEPSVLTNRAISQTYPPGSTFKLVDVAAALSTGRYNPDSRGTASPSITLEGTNTQLRNFNSNPCGGGADVTMREALQRSCNTYFAELVRDLGEDTLRQQVEDFGIGQELAVPMTVSPSTIGEIPDDAALQQSSIGQRDVALTPLQNAMVAAAIANDGVVMAPYLVSEIQGPDLQTIDTTEPDRISTAMDPGVAQTITAMMVNNENSYTGGGRPQGVQIAAKTGTAEHGPVPEDVAPHVWYVAFAPADDPQVAIAVLVESGGDRSNLAATGGAVAAPIGRAVIGAALRGSQ